MDINISNNRVGDASTINDSQYTQQEECQNTDTELNIQHHLVTSDGGNKASQQAQEEHRDAVRSRGQ